MAIASNSFACIGISIASFLFAAMSISSTLLVFAFIFLAETVSISAVLKTDNSFKSFFLTHSMASAVDSLASVGVFITELIGRAVILRSASDFFTDMFTTHPVASFIQAVIMSRAFNAFTFIVFTDVLSIWISAIAMFILSAWHFNAFVIFAEVSVVVVALAHCMSNAVNLFAFISIFFASTDFVRSAVLVDSAVDIDANVVLACELFALVCTVLMSSAINSFADIVETSFLDLIIVPAVTINTAGLLLALIILAQTVTSFAAFVIVAAIVTNALHVFADAFDLVAFLLGSNSSISIAMFIQDAFLVDALVRLASLILSTE